jgi:hypothetical protein
LELKEPINKTSINIIPKKKEKEEFKSIIAQHYSKQNQDKYENLVDEYLFSINNSSNKKTEFSDFKNKLEIKDYTRSPLDYKDDKKEKIHKKNIKVDAQTTFFSELEQLNNKNENSDLENLIGYESEGSSEKKRKPLLELNGNKKSIERNKSPFDIKKTLYFETSEEKGFEDNFEKSEKEEVLDETQSSKFKSNLMNKLKKIRNFSIRKTKTSDSVREPHILKVNKKKIVEK